MKEANKSSVKALDGGWGWIVCIGAFAANFIADGTMLSSGVQMIAFLDYFGESKAMTAWVSSSQIGLSMMMGPVVSYLIARYSVRTVTMAGGIIAFLATLGGAFSPTLIVLILTYGVLCGIGICFFFISSIVAVGVYFSEKRAIATGIAMSGSGIGVIVYPYFTETLLTVYDWRNAMLIIAAICLNACVCGALFKPLHGDVDVERNKLCACLDVSCTCSEDSKTNGSFEISKNELLVPLNKTYNSTSDIQGKETSFLDKNKNSKLLEREFNSELNLNSKHYKNYHESTSNNLLSPALRRDVFYSGSIKNIPANELLKEANLANGDDSSSGSDSSSVTSKKKKTMFKDCVCLMRKPDFLLLLGCMILWTAQGVTMTYVPDMTFSKGFSRQKGASLISIIGVTNTLVRIFAGFIVDLFHVRTVYLYAIALCLGAVTNIAFPLCDSFPLLIGCAIGFGMCMGTVVCLRTILIADILGISMLTQAFGIIAFFQGLAFTVNPPLAGFVFDVTGSYVYLFLMPGCYYVVSLAMCIGLICARQHLKPENQVLEISDEEINDEV